jgi:hypothetical protein
MQQEVQEALSSVHGCDSVNISKLIADYCDNSWLFASGNMVKMSYSLWYDADDDDDDDVEHEDLRVSVDLDDYFFFIDGKLYQVEPQGMRTMDQIKTEFTVTTPLVIMSETGTDKYYVYKIKTVVTCRRTMGLYMKMVASDLDALYAGHAKVRVNIDIEKRVPELSIKSIRWQRVDMFCGHYQDTMHSGVTRFLKLVDSLASLSES